MDHRSGVSCCSEPSSELFFVCHLLPSTGHEVHLCCEMRTHTCVCSEVSHHLSRCDSVGIKLAASAPGYISPMETGPSLGPKQQFEAHHLHSLKSPHVDLHKKHNTTKYHF